MLFRSNEEQLAVAMAVSPMQEVIITSQNMKDENAIQEQAEIDALAWWISYQPKNR